MGDLQLHSPDIWSWQPALKVTVRSVCSHSDSPKRSISGKMLLLAICMTIQTNCQQHCHLPLFVIKYYLSASSSNYHVGHKMCYNIPHSVKSIILTFAVCFLKSIDGSQLSARCGYLHRRYP